MPKTYFDEPVSVRISPELKNKLLLKHPKQGELSKVLRVILQRYIDGKILGVKIEGV